MQKCEGTVFQQTPTGFQNLPCPNPGIRARTGRTFVQTPAGPAYAKVKMHFCPKCVAEYDTEAAMARAEAMG